MMGTVAYLNFGQNATSVAAVPTAGAWYQTKKGDTPWAISKAAYVNSGLTDVKSGLYLLNDNPSNANIRKAATGWEAYKINGLQLTPHYAPGVMYASYKSGSAYPLLWVPPIDGRTADQMGGSGTKGDKGDTGAPGGQGIPGPKGDKGDTGAPGHTPTNAEISALIKDYMEENPPGGTIDPAAIARAVADYLKANPVEVPPVNLDTIADAVAQYIKTHPPVTDATALAKAVADFLKANPVKVPAVDPAAIAAAVSDYLQAHPIAQGKQGIPGIQGPPGATGARGATGAPGRTPTTSEVAAIVADYMKANPPASGGGGFDMDTARKFVDSRFETNLNRLIRTGELKDKLGGLLAGGGGAMWPGLIAAGIFGGAIVVLLNKKRRA